MFRPLLLLLAGTALISAAFAVRRVAPSAGEPGRSVSAPASMAEQDGHLLVIVRGTGTRLSIVDVVPKADPCGANHVATALHGYFLVAVDESGAELGSVPLDLSAFDLQPDAKRGVGPRVVGDQVFERDVAVLVKLPKFVAATRLEIRQHGERHSVFGAGAYRAALAKENK